MSILDLFFGGGGSSGAGTATAAGNIVASAANQGQQNLQSWYDTATASEKPYLQLGSSAAQTLGGLYNLPGYAKVDPTQQLMATPGYQWLQGQGVSALNRAGAASGLTGSGALGAGLMNYGQNLAQTYAWQPYVSALTGFSNAGQTAANTIGNWAIGTGSGQANLGMQGAQAQSQAMMNALALNQQQQALQSSNLGGMLGLGIGAYGSGLFDKIGQGIGNAGSWIGGLFDMGGPLGLAAV